MTDNHPSDEIVMDLNYEEICYLLKGLFISQYPEYNEEDLLVKVSLNDDSIQATFKPCPNRILSMAHRGRGRRLDS